MVSCAHEVVVLLSSMDDRASDGATDGKFGMVTVAEGKGDACCKKTLLSSSSIDDDVNEKGFSDCAKSDD